MQQMYVDSPPRLFYSASLCLYTHHTKQNVGLIIQFFLQTRDAE